MYQTGLDLQQKLDKIIDYDRCNPDIDKNMGIKEYCKELFKDQKFFFWSSQDLNQNCESITDSPKFKES